MPTAKISFQQIESAACAYYRIHPGELRDKSIDQKTSRRRFVAAHLARTHGAISYPVIARLLDFKSHNSAMHAVRRADELLEHVPAFARDVAAIEEILVHQAEG